MNIPQIFTRTSFCEHCAKNNLPYTTPDQLKLQKLKFIIIKNNEFKQKNNEFNQVCDVRNQSKPGRLGYTPHLFFSEAPFDTTQKIIQGFKVCSVVNCGVVIEEQTSNRLSILFVKPIQCIWETLELVNIYEFKNRDLMLDSKEPQIRLEQGIISELCPN